MGLGLVFVSTKIVPSGVSKVPLSWGEAPPGSVGKALQVVPPSVERNSGPIW